MNEEQIRAMFTLAGLSIKRIWRLPNGYLGLQSPISEPDMERDRTDVRQSGLLQTDYRGGPTLNVVFHWMRDYEWRFNRPAWLVQTQHGLIQITPRKRVTDIEWSDTPLRAIVTEDDTTKSNTNVHAWDDERLLRYLKRIGDLLALL
jgi:hypothetical protein